MKVYLIRNKLNGMVYVGQTIRSVEQRWTEHRKYKSTCRYLRRAIELYGPETFEVLELASALTRENLNILEEHFIREFNSLAPNGYNLSSGGKNRIASQETRMKMSTSRKGKPLLKRRGKPAWNAGLKFGQQAKWIVNRRIEAATKTKIKPIQCVETGVIYSSSKAAILELGLNQGNLSEVLRGKRKHVKGLTFRFLETAT